MGLRFRGSFFRDLDNIQNHYMLRAVQEKITEIKIAKTIHHISRLKRFKERSKVWYKTEVHSQYGNKIYWILGIVKKNVFEFRRIKSETFFKKQF